MDRLTLEHYENHASRRFEQYASASRGIAEFFQASFPVKATILDIGAGSGRDLNELIGLGYDAWGIEPAAELRQLAANHFPSLSGRIAAGALPQLDLPADFPSAYDGIVCSAVLMHLPENELRAAMLSMHNALRMHGRLLISISMGRTGLDAGNRDVDGRLYTPLEPDSLILLAERLAFKLINHWTRPDTFRRSDLTWETLLLEKLGA